MIRPESRDSSRPATPCPPDSPSVIPAKAGIHNRAGRHADRPLRSSRSKIIPLPDQAGDRLWRGSPIRFTDWVRGHSRLWRESSAGIRHFLSALLLLPLLAVPATEVRAQTAQILSIAVEGTFTSASEGSDVYFFLTFSKAPTTGSTYTVDISGDATIDTDYTLTCAHSEGYNTRVSCTRTGNILTLTVGTVASGFNGRRAQRAIKLTAVSDMVTEASGEMVTLTANPCGGNPGACGKTLTINDPPTSTTVTFGSATYLVHETAVQNIAQPVIVVDPPFPQAITIPIIYDDDDMDTATSGTDYEPVASYTIPANHSRVSFDINILDDIHNESGSNQEFFTIKLNTAMADPDVITVENDDIHETRFEIIEAVTVNLAGEAGEATEGTDTGINVPVTIVVPAEDSFQLHYQVTGTATRGAADAPGTDVVIPETVTVDAGATSVNIPVTIQDDRRYEGEETVILRLLDQRDNNIGDYKWQKGGTSQYTLTIVDNESPPRRTPPPEPEPESEPQPSTPVTLSVEAGQVDEGQPVRVTATLGQALDEEVRIPLTLMAITAEAQDFGALTEIVIPANQTMGMAQLPTFADSDPDDEILSILLDESKLPSSLRPGQPSQVEVTIRDVEPLQGAVTAWQTRFARTAAGHVLDGIAARISATPTVGLQGQLAGYRIHTGHTEENPLLYPHATHNPFPATLPDTRSLTMREFLSASSMSWSGESTDGSVTSFWAQGAGSRFDGKSGESSLDGEVLTALLGLDQTHTTGRRGLVLSHSQGEGNYQSRSQGQIESTQTLLTPWLSKEINDRITIWGALGYGTGELTIQRNGREDLTTDTRAGLIAFGSRGALTPQEDTDGVRLSLISDVLWLRTRADAVADGTELDATSAHGSRMRLGVEGRWNQTRKSGRIQTRLESALRHDGGDAERGLGVEVGGGVHWQDPQRGLDIEIRGRTLLVHHDEEIKERGVSISMGYDPSPIHQGFAFTIKQDWGVVSSGVERLFQADVMDRTDSAASQRFTTQAGYRFKVRDGRYTAYPYLGHSLDTEERAYTLGWRLESVMGRSARTLALKAIRQEHTGQASDHRIQVEAGMKW